MNVVERRYGAAMDQALALAAQAARRGEVPVGAVVLGPGGKVLAQGANACQAEHDPTAHAEILALRAAGAALGDSHLEGCTLVVTLEPCTMCAGAIVAARIDHLVFGAFDDKAGAVTSLFDVLRDPRLNHRPRVTSGVLEADCAALLEEFFTSRR